METFKISKTLTNSSTNYLERPNKRQKTLSEKLPTNQTSYKKRSGHFVTFPENFFNFVNQEPEKKNKKCHFQRFRKFRTFYYLKVVSEPFCKTVPRTNF